MSNERKRCLANVHCANTATHGFDGKALACRQHAGDWEEVTPPNVPSAPRHDAGTGDHPAPTCECGARLNLKGQTKCADCIDRMIASPPPSPGGEDVGALLDEATEALEALEFADYGRGERCVVCDGLPFEDRNDEIAHDENCGLAVALDRLIEIRAAVSRLTADVERLTKQNAAVFEANERLSAQLAAASDRYARAVAGADEVRGRLVAERDEAQAGYHALDRNWQTVHSMAMDPIRAAVGLPDGTVPEIVEAIREARGKALEEAIGAAMSLADSTACHPAARRSLEVLCGRLRALAAPAAKGGA